MYWIPDIPPSANDNAQLIEPLLNSDYQDLRLFLNLWICFPY